MENKQTSLPPAIVSALEVFGQNTQNFEAAAVLVGKLHDYGMHEKAAEIRDHLVYLLRNVAASGSSPDVLLTILHRLYISTVKKIESEEHVRGCYQSWIEPVARMARKYNDQALPKRYWNAYPARPWRPGFFLHNAAIVGHTEALLELLEHRPRGGTWENPIVYTLEGNLPALNERLAALNVSITNLQDQVSAQASYFQKFSVLRQCIARDRVSHLVWVSAPLFADFAMPMRLAPAQILWTLKFHPFQIPEIDGYITYGAWSENTRVVHGETWQVVPFMMSNPSGPVLPEEVSRARQSFSHYDILFGTLARTEKLNSVPFLESIVRILRANPRAAYLWTGREHHPGIQGYFVAAGVADRCHYIGWVNTSLYVRVLDVFLESFPFGCGLTGIQALEAGTPFVSFAAPETQYGMHFLRPLLEGGAAAAQIQELLNPGADSAPLLYASNADNYVEMANRLARDPEFRQRAGRAGQQYYRRYLSDADRMASRFYEVLARLKVPKRGAA